MKGKMLGLLAVVLLAGPVTANAVVVNYSFAVSDWVGSPSPFSSLSGTFAYDGSTLVDFAMTIGSKVYGLSDVVFTSNSIGGKALGFGVQSGTNDFYMAFSTSTLSLTQFAYATPSDVGNIFFAQTRVLTTSVPEPGTLALLGLGLAGLGVSRRRKAK